MRPIDSHRSQPPKKASNGTLGLGHIDVDLQSGSTVEGAAANVDNASQADTSMYQDEKMWLGEADYEGVEKRGKDEWHDAQRPIAMLLGNRRTMGNGATERVSEKLSVPNPAFEPKRKANPRGSDVISSFAKIDF